MWLCAKYCVCACFQWFIRAIKFFWVHLVSEYFYLVIGKHDRKLSSAKHEAFVHVCFCIDITGVNNITNITMIFTRLFWLYRFCRPIMTKPKPVTPVAPEVPSPSHTQGSDQPQGGDTYSGPKGDEAENTAGGTEVPPTSGEPMETDKSGTA